MLWSVFVGLLTQAFDLSAILILRDLSGYLGIQAWTCKETWKEIVSIHRIGGNAKDGGAKAAADLIENKPGKHSDGGGLYLQVASVGQASWVWRHKPKGEAKEKWRSIGPASVYKIEEAREIARNLRKAVHEGRDPFQMLRADSARPAGKTFATAMSEYLKAKSPHWAASNQARGLRRYEFLFGQIPEFVALPVKAIDQAAKNKALATWDGKTKARRDVGFYIEAIIRYVETGKLRLPNGSAEQDHFEAMPWRDVPAFYARIAALGTTDARALRFTILSGARTDEVIGAEYGGEITKAPATWREITEVDGLPTWVIPGGRDGRMKGKKTHRVPLTAQMVALLGERRADDVALFDVSSANAMLNILKVNGGNGSTVHGFRSSFSDWVIDTTNYGSDLADLCIAHFKRDKVRRAYQRSDQLEKRRAVMQEWSDFVTSKA
jgi:integrase